MKKLLITWKPASARGELETQPLKTSLRKGRGRKWTKKENNLKNEKNEKNEKKRKNENQNEKLKKNNLHRVWLKTSCNLFWCIFHLSSMSTCVAKFLRKFLAISSCLVFMQRPERLTRATTLPQNIGWMRLQLDKVGYGWIRDNFHHNCTTFARHC